MHISYRFIVRGQINRVKLQYFYFRAPAHKNSVPASVPIERPRAISSSIYSQVRVPVYWNINYYFQLITTYETHVWQWRRHRELQYIRIMNDIIILYNRATFLDVRWWNYLYIMIFGVDIMVRFIVRACAARCLNVVIWNFFF